MKHLSVSGDVLTILLDGKATGNAYTLMESILPPGGGTPPHVHRREDEGFLLISGEVTFFAGGKTVVLKPGEYLFAPRDVPHHYSNTGSCDAVLVVTATPAGIEDFFTETGIEIASRQSERIPLTPEAMAKLTTTAPKYGIEILKP